MNKRWQLLWLAGAMGATVGLYWPSMHNPVFFDDIFLFHRNGLNSIFLEGFAFKTRWLPYFLTAWVDLIFDDKVFAQRCINLSLHVLTGFVLYILIKQVTNHAAPHRNNERAAIVAALLFLLHPLAVYATGYLAQRTVMMATLFGLLALSAYFDGLVRRKSAYFYFSAIFYLLSVYSKEHALLIPFAALALTPLAVPLTRQTWRTLLLPFALYLPIAAWVIFEKLGILGRSYEPFAEQLIDLSALHYSPAMLWLLSALTQAALYFKYLALVVIPNPGWMSIDMRPPFAMNLLDPKYILGALALAAYGVFSAAWLREGGRRGLIGYALLTPLLLFVVEMSTVRIQEPFVLYRTYLWIPVLFLLVPALTNALSVRVFWPGAIIAALLLAAASVDRLNTFANHYALWDDAVRKLPDQAAPGSARAHNNRCQQNLRLGNLQAAITGCSLALQVDPKYKLAYQNRAFAYMKHGDFQPALQDALTVVERYPEDPHAYTLLGAIYQGTGQIDKALASYEVACARRSLAGCIEFENMKARNSAEGKK